MSEDRRVEVVEEVQPELREAKDSIWEVPLLPVRDTVPFPRMITPLLVGRERSLRAIEAAMAKGQRLAVVAQRDPEVQDPTKEDLYEVGAAVVIERMLRMPDGTTNILVRGEGRLEILELLDQHPYLSVRGSLIHEVEDSALSTEALRRAVLALFEKVVQISHDLPDDAYVAAMNVDKPGWLADFVAATMQVGVDKRQEILETFDSADRLQRISILLANELDVLELENRIQSKVQQEVDKSQREFLLREQMRAIRDELGEADVYSRDIQELREKVATLQLPDEVREKAEKELDRLGMIASTAPEVGIIRTYLDWIVGLPWAASTEDNLDVARAAEILAENHYGLPKAKERILEYIAVRKLAPDKMRSPILCFVGPPGTGKTSIGKSMAEALGRKFVRVSLGGIRDEAEIRGHRRTYVGAMPGRIIQTMRRAGTVNPLFMLDEVDKIGVDFRGDPSAALLEALDPEQNSAFSDHYLEVPYDLSRVMFITTANILDPIPPALRDRMEVIEFPGYIEEEKLEIAKRFLISRQMEQHGLDDGVHFSDSALSHIVRDYTHEAGVRNLEREIARILRKVARRVAEGKGSGARITAQSLAKYLGPPQFFYGTAEEQDEVGVATGVAWTEAGGDILTIEVTLMEGKGGLTLTGQLGDVMQESAQAALSYARSHSELLGIQGREFDKLDIHVHVPEGAIPKDGPSAGITMAMALISALEEVPVRRDVCMTGEITLRGRVLPVGGLKEKALAAHRAGIRKVILPTKNRKDLIDIPKHVRRKLDFIFVERMEEVLDAALLSEDEAEVPDDRTEVAS
jgi:ATP-dependent Lon protease